MNIRQFCVKFAKKNVIKLRGIPELAVTSGILADKYWLDTQLVKVWWNNKNSDMNGDQKAWKYPRKTQ